MFSFSLEIGKYVQSGVGEDSYWCLSEKENCQCCIVQPTSNYVLSSFICGLARPQWDVRLWPNFEQPPFKCQTGQVRLKECTFLKVSLFVSHTLKLTLSCALCNKSIHLFSFCYFEMACKCGLSSQAKAELLNEMSCASRPMQNSLGVTPQFFSTWTSSHLPAVQMQTDCVSVEY